MVLLDGPLCCMLNQPPETKKQISNQSSQIHGIRSNMSVNKSLHASIYVASTDTTTQNAREWEHSMHNNVVHVFHACLMMLASFQEKNLSFSLVFSMLTQIASIDTTWTIQTIFYYLFFL